MHLQEKINTLKLKKINDIEVKELKKGKLREEYDFLKKQDSEKKYLFKSGIFYIFLNEDAEYISKKYNLKLTAFGNDIKCGFPIRAEKKYEELLKSENITIINETIMTNKYDNFIKILNKIDLDNISPKDAINVLYELKEESK